MSAIRAQIPASSLRPMSPRWIPKAVSMSAKSDEARACRNSWRAGTRTETMRKLFGILTLVLAPVAAYAAENSLSWAYPVEPPPGAPNADAAPPGKKVNQYLLFGSYTGLPAMPKAVTTGKPLPCMQCHLANGGSPPESAPIGGFFVNQNIQQVRAIPYRDPAQVRPSPTGQSPQSPFDTDS